MTRRDVEGSEACYGGEGSGCGFMLFGQIYGYGMGFGGDDGNGYGMGFGWGRGSGEGSHGHGDGWGRGSGWCYGDRGRKHYAGDF